jgi:hypothetical protein
MNTTVSSHTSLIHNSTDFNFVKDENNSSSKKLGWTMLTLELVLVILMFVFKLLQKLANNGWQIKVKNILP